MLNHSRCKAAFAVLKPTEAPLSYYSQRDYEALRLRAGVLKINSKAVSD